MNNDFLIYKGSRKFKLKIISKGGAYLLDLVQNIFNQLAHVQGRFRPFLFF